MGVALVLSVAGLSGCGATPADAAKADQAAAPAQQPAAPLVPPASTPAAADANTLPAAVAGLHDPKCQTQDGVTQCRADGFLVKMRAGHCSTDGAYGTVGEGYLLSQPDGEDAEPRVELKGFHFACSVATAIRDTPEGASGLSWEYVVLPPTDTVKACQQDAKACQTKPGASVAWQVPQSGQGCTVNAAGDYTGDCPAGWISTDDFGDWGYSQ